MNTPKDKLEQVFREGFENYQIKASEKVWQNIDNTLFSANRSKTDISSVTAIGLPLLIMVGSLYFIKDEIVETHTGQPVHVEVKDIQDINLTPEEMEIYVADNLENIDNLQPKAISKKEETKEEKTSTSPEISKNSISTTETQEANNTYEPKKMPTLDDTYISTIHYKQQGQKLYSVYSINKLKGGVLLVRLQSKQKTVQALIERGKHNKAQEVKAAQDKLNKNIIEAFKSNYTFSKVMFFYAENTQNVKDMNFEKIFLNENLEADESAILDPSKTFYMVLDIGAVEIPGTPQSSGTLISNALVIKDRYFDQMASPFPYFSKIGNNNNDIQKALVNLDAKLHTYHDTK